MINESSQMNSVVDESLKHMDNKKPSSDIVVKKIVDEITKKNLSKVEILDLGTGTGYNAWKIKRNLPNLDIKITCVDMDESEFKLSGEPNVKYIKSDLDENFLFGKFDFIIGSEVVEHLENPYHFLRNCYSNLENSGAIYLTTPNVVNIFSIIKILITGIPYLFGDMDKYGHKTPFFPFILERSIIIEKKETGVNYKIESFYNKNVIRLYPFRKNLIIPGNHSRLFGESAIFKITKN